MWYAILLLARRVENGKIVPWVESVIRNKIKQILDIALENGNDSLVLSAFGCGAYGTPPEQMARFFADVLTPSVIVVVEISTRSKFRLNNDTISFCRYFGTRP